MSVRKFLDDTGVGILIGYVKTALSNLSFSDISGTADATQIPNLSTSKLTSGTLSVERGGTGGATADAARTSLDVYSKSEVDGLAGKQVFYGTCDTANGTAAKTVACTGFASANNAAGTVLIVKFSDYNSVTTAITLNVNDTGTTTVKGINSVDDVSYRWLGNETVTFVHDGTYWVLVKDTPTVAAGALYAASTTSAPAYGTLPLAQGGTGATSAANARSNLNVAAKTTRTTVSVATSSWTASGSIYYYTFSSYSASSYDIDVDLNWDSASDAQIEAWKAAEITGSYSYNRIYCRGTKPTVALPLVLYVHPRS